MTANLLTSVSKEGLRNAVTRMRDVLPQMSEAEAGFHAALAYVTMKLAERISASEDPLKRKLVEVLVEMLDAGQQLSGEDFAALARFLGTKAGPVN